MPLTSLSPIQGATTSAPSQPARRGRKSAAGGQSLLDHVLAVLESGAQTNENILAAIKGRGYKFSTSNPLNSLGVILYGKNPKLDRVDGKFSLGGRAGSANGAGPAKVGNRGGRRKISQEARERIAAAQRARWAKQKSGE